MNKLLFTIIFTILKLSAFGSLLAVLIFIFKPFIKDRVSKAFLYYIWLLVLFRLCLPFGVNISVPAALFEKEAPVADTINGRITDAITENFGNNFKRGAQDYALMPEGRQNRIINTYNNDNNNVKDGSAIADSGIISGKRDKLGSFFSWLKSPAIWFTIWILGAVYSFGWHIFGYIRFSGMIKRTAVEPDGVDLIIFSKFNKGGRARFILSEFVKTPMLLGIIRPVIAVPLASYAKSGRAEYLMDILRHEFTHYRRKDMIYKWFSMAVTSLHWFNPLMILIRREINIACELSCDEAVIRYLNQKQKQHYGETLLVLAAVQACPTGIVSTTMYEEKAQLKERLLFIMNYKAKTRSALVLSLVLLAVFTGCGAVNGVSRKGTSQKETNDSASSYTVSRETAQKPKAFAGDVTLYEKYGLTIAIPNDIISQLIIFTDPKTEIQENSHLLSAYEKRSYEAALADYPNGHAGHIFSIVRYTKAQYEQFLCSDGSGLSFFAKDSNYYYGWLIPTDVQFYSKDNVDMESDEWKSWAMLNEKCKAIKDDFIARNNLIAYSDSEFWSKDFTYNSNHVFLTYYPYYAYTGSKEEVWVLVLSQPATKGDKGIWCVERWKDQHGNIYPYFPAENGIPSDEYYSALQAECDEGKNLALLHPEHVALDFVKKVFDHNEATLDSFELLDDPDVAANLYKLSTGNIYDYMPKLLAGEAISYYEFLPCLEKFTFSIWKELEQTYGGKEEWWNQLLKALNDFALSYRHDERTDQSLRNYYIGKAFLTSDGAYSEGLSDIIVKQWEHDRALYSACLNERFSEEEASALRSSITYSISNSGNLFSLYIPDSQRSICLDVYPVEFPFACNLVEKSRTSYRAESFGKVIIVESDGLQATYLNPYEGVYTVTTIRTNKEGNAVAGIAVGSTEEFLLSNWPYKLKKQIDGISYDDEAWFGEYDIAYSYTPEESTKSVVFLIKDDIISGIEIINGLDGPAYMP